jgi:hypothetical protein
VAKFEKPIPLAFKPSAVFLAGKSGAHGSSRNRLAEMTMQLRIEELRMEHARLVAEEREKDRELARFRIEERRRLREDMRDSERIAAEDAELVNELETGLARTRDRLTKSDEALKAAADEQKVTGSLSPEDQRIAEEIAQVLAGTWKPPA